MIKGKTTIQLFDAATNQLESEYTSENMLTDAVQNILNVKPELTFLAGDIRNVWNHTLPITKEMLGGIMLWRDRMAENGSNILPSISAKMIGMAGGAYANETTYRGSYNLNESCELENGFRHVWDFGTDKANGTFSCVTLTSKKGGECGWVGSEDSQGLFSSIYYFNQEFNSNLSSDDESMSALFASAIPTTSSNLPEGVKHFEKNYHLGRYAENEFYSLSISTSRNEFGILKIITPNSDKISINDVYAKKNHGCKYEFTSLAEIVTGYSYLYSYTIQSDGSFIIVVSLTSTNLVLKRINPVTAEVIETITLNTSGIFSTYNSVTNMKLYKFDSKYVLIIDNNHTNYNCIYFFDESGDFLQIVDMKSTYGVGEVSTRNSYLFENRLFINLANCTVIVFNASMNDFYITRIGLIRYNSVIIYDYKKNYPYVLVDVRNDGSSYNSGASSCGYQLLNPYLGTINNLDNPITKTPAQTMKITYDLIQTE